MQISKEGKTYTVGVKTGTTTELFASGDDLYTALDRLMDILKNEKLKDLMQKING